MTLNDVFQDHVHLMQLRPLYARFESIGVTFFSNRLGGGAVRKCSNYHQNSDGIGFLFIFDLFPYQDWDSQPFIEGAQPNIGGGGGGLGSPKYI